MELKKDEMYRMVVALYAAVQYHRACRPDFFPDFGKKIEPFIQDYEGHIVKTNGQVEFKQTGFQSTISDDADIVMDYVDRLSGGNEYKFRVVCGAALHYFYIVKPVLLANVELFSRAKRRRLALELRFRYRAKRVRKELEVFDRSVRRPIEDYYRTIADSSSDTGDTRSIIRVIQSNILFRHVETA